MLRWGRSDVVRDNGRIRSVTLPGWAPGAWTDLQHLADTMQVNVDLLHEALPSSGRHGPCALFEPDTGRHGPRVKAAWRKRKGK